MHILQSLAILLAVVQIGWLASHDDRSDLARTLAAAYAGFLILGALFGPSGFADHLAYVGFAEAARNMNYADLVAPEGIGRALLKLLVSLSGSPEHGVDLLTYLVFGSTLTGIALLSRSYAPAPANVAVLLALAGPLLAFNTLRASPAYLLVAFVILRGPRWDGLTAGLLLLALGFHVTVVLPTGALVLYALFRWALGDRPRRNAWVLGVLLALAIAGQLALRSSLSEAIQFFSEGSELARLPELSAYLDEELFSGSIFHDLWFLGVAAVGVALFWADRKAPGFGRRQLFMAFFLIMTVLHASPVAAHRFSLYLLIPLILGTDYHQLLPSFTASRAYRFGFPLAVGALFAATFLGNLARRNIYLG